MNDQEMRAVVAGLYDGPKWKTRVAKMRPEQIYMIYHSKQVLDDAADDEPEAYFEQLNLDI